MGIRTCAFVVAALATLSIAGTTHAIPLQKLGCAYYSLVPIQAGMPNANYGEHVDPDQDWLYIEGDPLIIGAGSKGTLAVWVCQPDGIVSQYDSDDDWGTNVWLNGTNEAGHYATDYFAELVNGTKEPTAVSHVKATNGDVTTITTVMTLGSSAELRQVISYIAGSHDFKRRWELKNTSGGELTDLRFLHGGDATYGGLSTSRSWWNAAQNMVYLSNSSFDESGAGGFYGSPATPASHYFAGDPQLGADQAMAGRLGDTTDSNFVDAGYQLEWDRASLAAGATWVIEAFQSWTDPTRLAVLAPADQLVRTSSTAVLEFYVHNLDSVAHQIDLTATTTGGYATTIPGASSRTLNPLERASVVVIVEVPENAVSDSVHAVKLDVLDPNDNRHGDGSSRLTVFQPGFTISPLSIDFGTVGEGQNATRTVTLTNTGAAVLVGALATTDAIEAPFSIVSDTCSNHSIAASGTCTIDLKFAPTEDAGLFKDSFDIAVVSPAVLSQTVSVKGTAGPGPCSNPNAASCPTGDTDGDGVVNSADACLEGVVGWTTKPSADYDGDGCFDKSEDSDDDGDGKPDASDACPKGAKGWTSNATTDQDGDGCRDSDEDSDFDDADGTTDEGDDEPKPTGPDSDGDGVPDSVDSDADNDGLTNEAEGEGDRDEDGIPNWLDLDSDGDHIHDIIEAGLGALDTDGDGRIDDTSDDDHDGLLNAVEKRRVTPPDHDGDGTPDYLEDDSDNDGVLDEVEGYDADNDEDGIPNYLDPDDDGDGIPTADEGATERDTDRDARPDYLDDDDDDDGVPTRTERGPNSTPRDTDDDGTPDYLDTDDDGDGIPTRSEAKVDIDGDNVPNYLDTDSDNDSFSDREERGRDDNDNGVPDSQEEPTYGIAGGALCAAVPGVQRSEGGLVFACGVLLLLALGRRRRKALGRAALLVTLAAAGTALVAANASAQGFRLDAYRTPALATDGLQLASPSTLEAKQWSLGVNVDYANDPLVMELNAGDTGSEYAGIVDSQLNAHVAFGYGAIEKLSLFGVFNVVLVEHGERTPMPGAQQRVLLADGAGLGDARLGARYRFVGGGKFDRAGLGVQAALVLPLAEWSDGDQNFRGEGNVAGDLALLGEVDLKVMKLGASVGARLRRRVTFVGMEIGSELTLGAGARVPILRNTLEGLLEAQVNTLFSDAFSRSATPAEMLLGIRANLMHNWRLSLGAGPGLQRGIGAPDYRVLAGVSYVSGKKEEPAPVIEEVSTPDPDQDGDQIVDRADQCPTEAEDVDGFEDQDGCPENDTDRDGVLNANDQCPNDAEDKDAFQDDDGCPDPDNDNDALADIVDRCPNEAEDKDGNQDEDGCPDLDDDGDGVPDTEDKCPTVRGDVEHQGCSPTVSLEQGQIKISQRIEFANNSGELKAVSTPILEAVQGVLETNPNVRKVIVQGHTDGRGPDKKNLELSKKRAASVVAWLAAHGVATDKLAAWGCGESQLIANDKTDEGRQTNRRVEFHIADPAPETPAKMQGCEQVQ